eukprot:365582-Chlamydomonas_euryale.AAC.15
MSDDVQRRLKAERVKALLAGYYGAGPAAPLGGGASAAQRGGRAAADGQPASPAQPDAGASRYLGLNSTAAVPLDAPGFDARAHVESLTRAHPLERLLTEHAGMAHDVRELDGQLKMMIVEKYSEFIAAADAVRTMRTNLDVAAGDMQRMRDIMGAHRPLSCSVTRSPLHDCAAAYTRA